MPLLETQAEALRKRFRHFDAERAAPLFHQDQDGRWRDSKTKHEHPAVLMQNGARWLYDRRDRPAKRKTIAAPGPRSLLTDDPRLEGEWFTVVEGEGDAVALLSVGITGVVCIGGTDGLGQHAQRFHGKRVVLLLDGDAHGREAVGPVALQLANAGARVQVAKLPEGTDPEDFLAGFDTPEAAAAELRQVLGHAEEIEREALRSARREQDAADGFTYKPTWSARVPIPGEDHPALVVTVWETPMERPALAVYAPLGFGLAADALPPYPGKEPEPASDPDLSAAWGWRVLPDGLRVEATCTVYEPAGQDGLGELLREGALTVPPPPPEGPASPVDGPALWRDLLAYFHRWLDLAPGDAEAMAAYSLLTWRVEDAHFDKTPFLRFFGPSGSGKTTAEASVARVSFMALEASMTAENIHRVVEQFTEFTLCWDEFNPDRMARDAARNVVNTLNASFSRSARMLRVENVKRGAPPEVRAFRMFGPKLLAGYLPGEDVGFRRRTVEIDMSRVQEVADAKRWSQPPRSAREEATELRRRLLQWRGQELARGQADPTECPASAALKAARVHLGLDAYWPLLHVVPEGCPEDARRALVAHAQAAEAKLGDVRSLSVEAYVLEALAALATAAPASYRGHPCVPLAEVHRRLEAGGFRLDVREVGRVLQQLGVPRPRARFSWLTKDASGPDRGRFVPLDPDTLKELTRVMAAEGVATWDPQAVGPAIRGLRAPDGDTDAPVRVEGEPRGVAVVQSRGRGLTLVSGGGSAL